MIYFKILYRCLIGEINLFLKSVSDDVSLPDDQDSRLIAIITHLYNLAIFPMSIISNAYQCFFGYFLAVASAYEELKALNE